MGIGVRHNSSARHTNNSLAVIYGGDEGFFKSTQHVPEPTGSPVKSMNGLWAL